MLDRNAYHALDKLFLIVASFLEQITLHESPMGIARVHTRCIEIVNNVLKAIGQLVEEKGSMRDPTSP